MSIRDDMIQRVIGNPGKYSIQELQTAMKSGSLPAYVVVPIIQDKVQQQKQMQAAMQMQQPKQPPIAEQIMQEADQMGGVAQLPSNLPEQYAGGGIVAFDEGGEVERYQEGGRTNPPWSAVLQSVLGISPTEEQYEEDRVKKERERIEDELRLERLREEQKQKPNAGIETLVAPPTSMSAAEMAVPGMGGYEAPVATTRRVPSDAEVNEIINQMRARGMRIGLDTYKDIKAGRIPMPTESTATPAAKPPVAPAGPGVGDFGIAGPYAPSRAAIGDIFSQLRAAQTTAYPEGKSVKEEIEPLLKGFTERSAAREAARKAEISALRGEVKGQAYEGLEADLRKEAEQLGADKETARNMAIFKAGLAMMAGTSRNALQNIGAGAMVGAEDYQRAATDIKKAQKENRLMMSHIEQARRAEQRGDVDKRVEELGKASDREEKRDEFFVSGLANAGVKDIEQRRQLMQNLTTVTGGVYGHQLAAEASRAKTEGRGEMSEYQKQMLLAKARAEYPIEKARMEYAKSKGYSRTPKLGEDQEFDGEVNRYWMAKIHTFAGLPYDSGAVPRGPAQPINYKAAGYNVLGRAQ